MSFPHPYFRQFTHPPALSRQVPSVTDGKREIFTASPALQSKAGDINTPPGLSLLRHSLKALDVGISSQPHGCFALAQYSHYMKGSSNLLATKLFDQLTVVSPEDF